MQLIHRHLVAIAVGAALASPAAFAQSQVGNAGSASTAIARPAVAKSSDAISARTTGQESRGAPAPVVAATTSTVATPMRSWTAGGSDPVKVATGTAARGNWWTNADRDGDGRLSATEAVANAGLNSRFAAIDADKDGFVTQDEYSTFFAANAGPVVQPASGDSLVVTRDAWLRLDADADSRISLAEAMPDADLSSAFIRVDGNKDGFVTQDEYRAYARATRP